MGLSGVVRSHNSYWHPLYDKFRSNASASRCVLIQSLHVYMPLNCTAPPPAELEDRQWARFCSVVKSGPPSRSHWHSMPVFAAAASLERRAGFDSAPISRRGECSPRVGHKFADGAYKSGNKSASARSVRPGRAAGFAGSRAGQARWSRCGRNTPVKARCFSRARACELSSRYLN